ncbi:MAG TPA: alpha/beta hydrolase [Nocardioidaceae bacterium]|nr:alpha/beta hydrolase [Nocardioidaceae bacterium]
MIEHRSVSASIRARHVRTLTRTAMKPVLTAWPLRGPFRHGVAVPDLAFTPVPGLRTTSRSRVSGDTWSAEYVEPKAREGEGAVLYLHGGAFQFCGVNTHRRLVHRLSAASGLPVLSVAYRQASRGFFQDALDDCEAAFHHLVHEGGINPGAIVLAGDSAGGMLAFALALRLAETGVRPAAVVGYSPWLDFDCTEKRAHPNAESEAMLPVRRLRHAARVATDTRAGDAIDPALSPINGDVSLLPPVLLYCAAEEVLRLDAELMAERLSAAGVPHSLIVWEGMVHAFPVLGHLLPESRAVIEETAAFVKRVTRRVTHVADVA